STAVEPELDRRGRATVLVDGVPEHFRVGTDGAVGLIDLADVHVGDPAMDLAVIALRDAALLPAVLAGCAPDHDEQRWIERALPLYVSLRRLSAARWTAEHAPG
ncbi:MAG: hypothetical protein H0X35_07090, partial [Pseudonocardiales bacterium]|nr:hypothetical protein [Pseudonocardiales bacterium]